MCISFKNNYFQNCNNDWFQVDINHNNNNNNNDNNNNNYNNNNNNNSNDCNDTITTQIVWFLDSKKKEKIIWQETIHIIWQKTTFK